MGYAYGQVPRPLSVYNAHRLRRIQQNNIFRFKKKKKIRFLHIFNVNKTTDYTGLLIICIATEVCIFKN